MLGELSIRILRSERPPEGSASAVAIELPGVDFGCERVASGNATIETLTGERLDLDLGHVQPIRVLRGVVEVNAVQQLPGGLLAQYLLEALPEVGVQVIQHQMDASGRTVDVLDQVAYKGNEVDLAPALGDAHRSAPGFGLDGDEQIAGAAAHVLVVLACRSAAFHRQRRAVVREQLRALLVDAHHRFVAPVRPGRSILALNIRRKRLSRRSSKTFETGSGVARRIVTSPTLARRLGPVMGDPIATAVAKGDSVVADAANWSAPQIMNELSHERG